MESCQTELTRSVLTLALGDGSLYKKTKKSTGYTSGGISIAHCAAQKPYLEYKVNEVKKYFPSKAKIRDYFQSSKVNGPKKYAASSWTTNSPKLNAALNIMCPRGYKEITPALLSLLGAQAIAWLYMDDGNLNVRTVTICMAGHSKPEIELTSQWINTLLGVEAQYREKPYVWNNESRKERYLTMSTVESQKFLDAIRPYAAPGMEYKFNLS